MIINTQQILNIKFNKAIKCNTIYKKKKNVAKKQKTKRHCTV